MNPVQNDVDGTADHGCDGVNVFNKNYRGPAGDDITDQASANPGADAGKKQERNIISHAGIKGDLRPGYRENTKAGRIQKVYGRVCYGSFFPHPGGGIVNDKNGGSRRGGKKQHGIISEDGWGKNTQRNIPDHTASEGCDHSQKDYSEYIHAAVNRYFGAGYGKCHYADNIQKVKQRKHKKHLRRSSFIAAVRQYIFIISKIIIRQGTIMINSDHQDDQNIQVHKRRKHYSGTHPHTFEEKYKERQPEKYADTVAKVIRKGSTPAGMHIPVMVDEVLSFLDIHPGQTGLDATLGYGGHTLKMLEKLEGSGHLYALDVDPEESDRTRKRLEEKGYGENILTVCRMNFADVDKLSARVGKFDFVLADLGVSSMQIDDPARGFSYKAEGPLDLRLNPEAGVSAAARLREVSEEELEGMLEENSDEPYARQIAHAIVRRNKTCGKIESTQDLRRVIEDVMDRELGNLSKEEKKNEVRKTCQRTFQAIRIDVNSEFEVLEAFMEKLPGVMKPGGKIAILTFHSGEDRIVKKVFKYFEKEGIYSRTARDVIRPTAEECRLNPRAHSTKMRWAVMA